MPMVDPVTFTEEQVRRTQGSFAPFPAPPKGAPSPLAPPGQLSAPAAQPEVPKSRMTHPPTVTITVDWVDVDGIERKEAMTLRILSFDEEIEVGRRAGAIAKVPWAQLPEEEQDRIRAVCTCFVMWPGMSAELKWAVTNDPFLALRLAQEVADQRALYFRGYVREGAAAPRAPRLEIALPPDTTP